VSDEQTTMTNQDFIPILARRLFMRPSTIRRVLRFHRDLLVELLAKKGAISIQGLLRMEIVKSFAPRSEAFAVHPEGWVKKVRSTAQSLDINVTPLGSLKRAVAEVPRWKRKPLARPVAEPDCTCRRCMIVFERFGRVGL